MLHIRCSYGWIFVLGFLLGLDGTSLRAEETNKNTEPIMVGDSDWPWWRGHNRNGIAAKQDPPVKWSTTDNILWKINIPGRGHGSPTVVGDQIFLATADHVKETQLVLCIDRKTGKELWQTEVHQGGFEKKGNTKSSLASGSIACDGKRIFVNFLHAGAIWLTALDRDGKKVWQNKVTDYILHQGFGASPSVYESLVIVTADNKGGGVICAYDRVSGKLVWSHSRPKFPNYTSPIILKVGNKDQIFMTGCELVTSLDPLTGKVIWETKGSTTECVTSAVTDGQHIFTSGGYPKNHISAFKADGSGKLVWENKTRVYVPSMLVQGNHLFAVLDAGVATCLQCETGKEIWSGRLGGNFSASPVLVDDRIYAVNETGKTYVFKALTTGLEILAENQLGDEVYSTPTICGNRIYYRAATNAKGNRQETLYCIGLAK